MARQSKVLQAVLANQKKLTEQAVILALKDSSVKVVRAEGERWFELALEVKSGKVRYAEGEGRYTNLTGYAADPAVAFRAFMIAEAPLTEWKIVARQ